MDPKKIRALLGLPETATDAEVNGKLEAKFKAATDAVAEKTALSQERDAIVASAKAAGYEFKGGKFTKLAQGDTEPKAGDSDETKALKAQLAAFQLSQGKAKIASAQELAKKFTTSGPVPPAMMEKLSKLFSMAEGAEILALSQDGAGLVRTAFDAAAVLKEVLEAIPGQSKEQLARMGSYKGEPEEKDKAALRAKGKEMVARIKSKKPEASGKK